VIFQQVNAILNIIKVDHSFVNEEFMKELSENIVKVFNDSNIRVM